MDSRVKALGHPVHPMFISFPLGLLSTAVVFDVIQRVTEDTRYGETAFYLVLFGLVGGAIAAVAGLIDLLGLPGGTRARRIGVLHGAGNAVVVVLFLLSLLLRVDRDDHVASGTALALELAAVVLALVTGWMGTELVQRMGAAVDDDAGLDAPLRLDTHVALRRQAAPEAVRGGTESRTKVAGHAPHPMLVVFPLSLFPAALLFDVLRGVTDDEIYGHAAFLSIAAGVLGGLVAAVPGLVDWLGVRRDTRAWRVGVLHLAVNITTLTAFAVSWLLRWGADDRQPTTAAVVVAAIALLGSFLGGWLGGELHERLGVGVDPGAHLDAPSSLKPGVIDLRDAEQQPRQREQAHHS
jgi:uncharacterized membrane protein